MKHYEGKGCLLFIFCLFRCKDAIFRLYERGEEEPKRIKFTAQANQILQYLFSPFFFVLFVLILCAVIPSPWVCCENPRMKRFFSIIIRFMGCCCKAKVNELTPLLWGTSRMSNYLTNLDWIWLVIKLCWSFEVFSL